MDVSPINIHKADFTFTHNFPMNVSSINSHKADSSNWHSNGYKPKQHSQGILPSHSNGCLTNNRKANSISIQMDISPIDIRKADSTFNINIPIDVSPTYVYKAGFIYV